MRNITSCSFCRYVPPFRWRSCTYHGPSDRKKRCSFAPSHDSCRECEFRNLPCSLRRQKAAASNGLTTRHRSILALPNPTSPSSSQTSDPGASYQAVHDDELCDVLVALYFDLMHDKQHIIFHPGTFLAEQAARRAPKYLVWAMCALIARFSDHPSLSTIPRRERGPIWLKHAIEDFNSRSEAISLASLQGAILLAFSYAVEGDNAREKLLSAQAIRMVQVMRLPNTIGTDSIVYETQVRLYWQCWMADSWHCARDMFPRHILDDPRIAKPMEEKQFSQLGSGFSPATIRDGMPGIGANRDGLWTAMLPLTEFHLRVMALNYTLLEEAVDPVEEYRHVVELAEKIEDWHESLPSRMHFNPGNFARHIEEGIGREYNVLHILYHFQSQLLYYRFLQDPSEDAAHSINAADHAMYASRCKAHATAMSEIMWAANIRPGLECFWSPVNGHLIVVASSIHLHTLMFDIDEHRTAKARELLEQNFKMLLQLREYWPTLENYMSRLHAFHKLCLPDGTSSKAFHMDHWMVRWLSKYDVPVEDKNTADTIHDIDLLSLLKEAGGDNHRIPV